MHEVLVNRLGGLSLPRKSVVRLTDRPEMTIDVYRGRKTTMQQQQKIILPYLTLAQKRSRWTQGHKFNNLGGAQVLDAAYQVSRPSVNCFCNGRFFKIVFRQGMAAILVM